MSHFGRKVKKFSFLVILVNETMLLKYQELDLYKGAILTHTHVLTMDCVCQVRYKN